MLSSAPCEGGREDAGLLGGHGGRRGERDIGLRAPRGGCEELGGPLDTPEWSYITNFGRSMCWYLKEQTHSLIHSCLLGAWYCATCRGHNSRHNQMRFPGSWCLEPRDGLRRWEVVDRWCLWSFQGPAESKRRLCSYFTQIAEKIEAGNL